jgi:HlyD family secretion protein
MSAAMEPDGAIQTTLGANAAAGTLVNAVRDRVSARLFRLSVRRVVVLLVVVTAGVAALVGFSGKRGTTVSTDSKLVYYAVQRGDLPITVTERGNLESQQNLQIICEVDDLPNDGINGTLIVWVIPNGASVHKDDLLVEFDSTHHVERLDLEILDAEKARAAQIQAQAKYDNQLTQNETNQAEAALKVKLAELELLMFRDQQNGTYKLEVQEIERQIDDANNEILAAKASLELKRTEKDGIEALFKSGYTGRSDLDRSRLEFLQAEGQYAAKMNRLQTQLATLAKKKTYEQQMKALTLDGNLETAKRKVIQVERDNEALLVQAKAALQAANEALKKEEERLVRFREQIDKCKIKAPQDGMVAYALTSNAYYREEIREGAAIRPRQPILSLPNLKQMQVKTSVHESVLDQVHADQTATVRVDAFPDRSYRGNVQSVAVMPDQGGWFSADTKVYETVVTILDEVDQLKPGMTAVVEVHVDELKSALTVPIQAVVQIKKESWCYVDVQGNIERRDVQTGRTNEKFVEIKSGLEPGQRVVLNPMSVTDKARAADESSEETAKNETNPEPAQPALGKSDQAKPESPKPESVTPRPESVQSKLAKPDTPPRPEVPKPPAPGVNASKPS